MSRTADRFSRTAGAYARSRAHAGGEDLDRLVEFASPGPGDLALDVATGPGHVLFRIAAGARLAVGLDPAPGMLEQARKAARDRGVGNAAFLLGEGERLPFPGGTFDLVTCRLAVHHFRDQEGGLRELGRVAAPAGRVVVEDSLAPADAEGAAFLNEVETVRDPTHVRSLTGVEWEEALRRAGLRLVRRAVHRKCRSFPEWMLHAEATGERAGEIEAWILSAPARLRDRWFATEEGRVARFTDEKVVLLCSPAPGAPA